jgi:sigma-E factor negative regulatory protein RseC
MSDEKIEHKGVILSINPEIISVEILNKSACSSCSSKSACFLGEVEAKVVQIENSGYCFFEEGEEVNVILKRSLGFKALWLSYLVPLIILIVTLVISSKLKLNEPVTGLAIIGAIALYYLIIYLLRNKLKKEFVFTIEKIKQ